jgi:hypothetical protein
VFSALELVCIMYEGFKRIEPGMDIEVDLSEEWGMAKRLEKEPYLFEMPKLLGFFAEGNGPFT